MKTKYDYPDIFQKVPSLNRPGLLIDVFVDQEDEEESEEMDFLGTKETDEEDHHDSEVDDS